MARFARVIAVDVPHHVTQRANARQFILSADEDRRVYLDLLSRYSELYQLSVIGYCLMSNHVHHVVIPRQTDSLALTFQQTHGRYATHWNAAHNSSGHAWQGRFYSCPLDERHLWEALRYIELNPLRARLVKEADEYVWSSAGAHFGTAEPPDWLDLDLWRQRWDAPSWREYLARASEAEADEIRESTHTGRPLGTPEFVEALEQGLQRRLARQRGGRPRKAGKDEKQPMLLFEGE